MCFAAPHCRASPQHTPRVLHEGNSVLKHIQGAECLCHAGKTCKRHIATSDALQQHLLAFAFRLRSCRQQAQHAHITDIVDLDSAVFYGKARSSLQ